MNIINIEHISKIFGEKVIFEDASFGIQQGDKIGIVGINGTGKSTVLRMIAGEEEPDQGQIIRQNGLKIAYLPQNPHFPKGATVASYVLSGNGDKDWLVQSNMTKLGIEVSEQEVENLSGGQRRKLALAKVLAGDFDVLLLDEPTNHLDIASREWIEEAVEAFDGTLLFVSHDRYFIQRFATRIWELADGTITDYPMGFAQYRAVKAQEKAPQPVKAPEKKGDTRPPRGNRSQQAARRQLTICEREIAKAEERIGALDAEMEANACDYEKLNALVADKDAAQAELDALYLRWEELSEAAGEA